MRLTAASSARSAGSNLARGDLAVKDGELMAQDQDLQILGGVTASEQHQQLDGPVQRQVGEFGGHQGALRVRVAGGVTIPSHGREHAARRPRPTLRTLQARTRAEERGRGGD
jgi:hypothetical protein